MPTYRFGGWPGLFALVFGRSLRLPGRRVGDGRIDVLGNVDAMFIGNLGTRSCRIQNEHFLRCDVVSRGLTDPVADIEFE